MLGDGAEFLHGWANERIGMVLRAARANDCRAVTAPRHRNAAA